MNYKKDLPIDHLNMVDTSNQHPQLYAKWSDLWAKAAEERDELKRQLDLEEAELSLKYRRGDLDTEGIKLTEDSIKKLVLSHSSYQELLKKYNEACGKVNKLNNAKQSFDHRRKMIEVISYHLRMEYFSKDGGGFSEEDARSYLAGKNTKERLHQVKKKRKEKK